MASIKIILRTAKANAAGEAPLAIRIIKDRRTKFMFLDYRIRPEHWDEKERRVKKSHPNSARLNNYITAKLLEAQEKAMELEAMDKTVLPELIKEEIIGKAPESFFKYADKYLAEQDNNKRIGTYRKAKAIIGKMKEYTGNRDLLFDHLTVTWLKAFEQWLRNKKNNRTNTVSSNFRTIRVIINLAINEELISADKNPFKRYRMTLEKVKKDFLTEDELTLLELAPLQKGSNKDHHRNMYIVSAYAGGLRISDMLLLKWKHFDGKHIVMQTKKTGSTVSVLVPDKALEILQQYQHPDAKPEDFIFPFLDNDADYSDPMKLFNSISSANAYTNDDLREIAKMIGIEKKVSFHSARHTFATQALMKGVRIEYVSKLMGHANIQTTQVYAKIVSAELDKAMEVFNKPKPTMTKVA